MLDYLNGVRRPVQIAWLRKVLYSASIGILGIILGAISKFLDETASNSLPYFLEVLDLRNFFSGVGVWIFLAVLIAVYSKSPFRSAVNVFCFFAGMVGSYYLYTVTIAGFFPESYMMIWVFMTIISPFLAFVCWYAKGKGILAEFISSIMILLIARQAVKFGFWYAYIKYELELLLLIALTIFLYQSPKQIIRVLLIGLLLYLLTAETDLFWGLL